MMRRIWTVLAMALLLTVPLAAQQAEAAETLLQTAIKKEVVDGNLAGAIEGYQKALAAAKGNRPVTAKTLLRLAECYQKMGDGQSRAMYERVIREYPDQKESVAVARDRLGGKAGASDGIVTRQVWVGPNRDDYLGAISADGRLLPYSDQTTGDLAIRMLATGETRRLTNKGPWTQSKEEAEWPGAISADGKTVAYGWAGKNGFELRTMPVVGGDARVLVRNEEISEIEPAAWSSDGGYIVAVVRRKDRNNQIVLVATNDGRMRTLKSLEWRYPRKVSLAPDNRSIVYDAPAHSTQAQRDIFLLATDGSRETAIVEHPADDYGALWTPDGKRIAFLSNRSGETGLWVVPVTEGKAGAAEEIHAGVGARNQAKPLGFSRNGSYYYASGGTGTSDVYVAEWDAETGRVKGMPSRLSERNVGRNIDPVISPDGKQVAYRSLRREGMTVVRSLETGAERDVTFEGAPPGPQVWFGDSRALLRFGTDSEGRQAMYRLEVETGQVRRLLQFRSGETTRSMQPGVSPDGKIVYYLARSPEAKEPLLRGYEVGAGREREIATGLRFGGGRSSLAVSPDGRHLAIAADNGDTRILSLVPLRGGASRELLSSPKMRAHLGLSWTVDGRHVLYTGASEDGQNDLWRVAVESGKTEKVALHGGGVRWVGVHPDGRRLVFSGGTARNNKREVWAIENFLPAGRRLTNP
ncbi:MAG: PD40 domain-containing protein [Acidobacteria bacterium]|nr:PD40 domain-containing protein [Acidobacteriota bacterium]